MEARLRWPDHVVIPIARALGLTRAYRHTRRVWNPEWVSLLGTKPDEVLAGELGLPRTTVVSYRNKLGVKPFGQTSRREDRIAARAALLASLSDIDLMQPIAALVYQHRVSSAQIKCEREKRGITRYRHSYHGTGVSELRRICVVAMRHAYPGLALEQIGAVLGITRERVRQIEESVMVEAAK